MIMYDPMISVDSSSTIFCLFHSISIYFDLFRSISFYFSSMFMPFTSFYVLLPFLGNLHLLAIHLIVLVILHLFLR